MKHLLKHPTITALISKMPTVKQLFFTVLGVLLLVFLFLSLLSYNINDPAWSHVGYHDTTTNIMGRLGAWISDILRVFFGLGSWWLVVALCFELMRLWWKHKMTSWQLSVIAHAFLLMFISGLLAGMGASTDNATTLWLGGVMGHELYGGLVAMFGSVWAVLFLCVLILVVASLTLNIPYQKLFGKFFGKARTKKTDTTQTVNATDPNAKTDTIKTDVPTDTTNNSQDEPFGAVTAQKAESFEPVATESLEDFLQNSGLREKIISNHLSAIQAKIQDDQSDLDQEYSSREHPSQEHHNQTHAQSPSENQAKPNSLPQTPSAHTPTPPNATDVPVVKVQPIKSQPTSPQPVKVQSIKPSTDKSYTDSHGMGVTTVHTNVKIQHADSFGKTDDSYDKKAETAQSTPAPERHHSDGVAYPVTNAPDRKDVGFEQADLSTDFGTDLNSTDLNATDFDGAPDDVTNHGGATHDTPVLARTDTPTSPHKSKPKSHAMSTLEYRMSLSPVPELSLLDPAPPKKTTYTPEELERLSELLEIKLQEFNISAKVINAIVGPVITRFEVELAAGVKVNRVTKIAQDLARSMSMASLRVLPVIVGKPYIGIEVPNRHREIVGLIELLQTQAYQDPSAGISIAIGQDISGRAVIADLAKAPHMLVAGTTGSGKSVLVNSFLLSMLLKYTPDELKLVLIDPKQLELANYADIPHLLTPVITDMTEATAALNWCVNEMDRRYKLIGLLRVRQLNEFNKKVLEAEQKGEPLLDPLWQAGDHVGEKPPRLKPLPSIVVVADEFADMIMQLGKTAEEPIVRLAQKARAAGIHLILATQRPVASVVTGLIKSNVPSRVALRVNSAMDSRLIIEESGAENMLGHGDMMFLAPGKNTTERVHGAYVKDDEVNRVTDAWRERGTPDYIDLSNSYTFEGEGSGNSSSNASGDEEYYNQAVAFFIESKKVSISSLQRKLSIGYNKAARIVDLMEERGVVSAPDNGGKRQLLI